ncbi:MAG: hypothetical protein ACTTJM_02545 [Bergeyella cardium]
MAYITISTFNQLTGNINIPKEYWEKITLEEFLDYLYNNELLYPIFNQLELNQLCNIKLLIKEGDNENIEYYKPIPSQKDTKDRVFFKGRDNASYHLYKDCEYLHRSYIDFTIPSDIQELDYKYPESEAVIFFRQWFEKFIWEKIEYKARIDDNFSEKYKHLIDKKQNLLETLHIIDDDFNLNEYHDIVERYNSFIVKKFEVYKDEEGFSIVKNLNRDYIMMIKHKNTSYTEIEREFNITKEVDNIIKERNKICLPEHYGEILYKLSKYSYCHNKEEEEIFEIIRNRKEGDSYVTFIKEYYSLENIRSFWKEHLNLSKKAVDILKKYFIWTYGIEDKSFDTVFLQNFNIHCCYNCQQRSFDFDLFIKEYEKNNNITN